LFSALAAAHFQHDGDQDERLLLELLESLPAPTVTYSDAATRNIGVSYVPVNDEDKSMMFAQQKGSQKQGTAETTFHPPIGRGWRLNRFRSGRLFPVATPAVPVVFFHWHDGRLHAQRETLQRLVERVPYLGRSSSVVRMSVVTEAPTGTIQPCQHASDVSLRVPYPGLLLRLQQCYELAQQSDTGVRAHRPPTAMQAYEPCVSEPLQSTNVFGECFVFQRLEGPRFPLEASVHLTSAVRLALLSVADNPRSEILSGHQEDGRPSGREHIAIVPLANIGYQYSDGDIKGVGIVLPSRITREERRGVLVALSRLRELHLGTRGVWRVDRVLAPPIWSLNWDRYARPSLAWATVTPMVFARHPRKSRLADEIVAEACREVGLPEPLSIELGPQPLLAGVPDARGCGTVSTAGKPILPAARRGQAMATADRQGHPARFRSHVRITFAQPVAGPVILGAGQYLGMGLLAPCERSGGAQYAAIARKS
jgi:CRISPR-associated protein Csb2